MGLMTFMRTRMNYLLVGGIAVVLGLFVLEPILSQGTAFFGGASQNTVGEIDGHEVKYEEFNQRVDQSLAQFKQQFGGSLNPQMQAMAIDQAWNAEVAGVLLKKEYDRLGLTVSSDELFDLMQGKNPSPIIQQYFTNPQTGQIDRSSLVQFLKSKDPQMKNQLIMVENEIERLALQDKYTHLLNSSVYVTSLEANDEYINRNKLANFKYVNLDYSSIPDQEVKLTDGDYSAYYNEHKNSFNNAQETRSFDYVAFSVSPTKVDSLAVKTQIEKLATDFRSSTNDSLFAAVNSDVQIPYTYISKGKLDPTVDAAVFALPAGSIYGPALSNGSYKLVKVIATKNSPDSVKASHILINPNAVGGEAQAFKLADSLKNLVAKGSSFAELAKTYSVDGSKDNGGELGSFTRGMMVPEFEEAAFNGRPGDLKVVKSQFGVHLLKIEKQSGSSQVAKLAYIEKNLKSSSKTQNAAYKAATAFLSEVKSNNFSSLAQKKGYTVGVADQITASQGFVAGLDNPRKLIQAAYASKKDEVLPEVYNMENAYIVAKVTAVKPKGLLALEDVKKDIEPMVRNQVKAKMLSERFQKANATNLAQLASKLGREVFPVENMVFSNPIIPGVAQENKVVGYVFGSQPTKISKPIAGERGVYVFVLDQLSNPAALPNMFKQKEGLLASLAQRSINGAFNTLQEQAKIKDNRVKFY